MISFRFHLVSLVAVFLALGLGVLTGTTVLNRGIVAQLERQTDQLAAQSGALRERVDDLEARAATWEDFGEQVMGFLVGGRLRGVDVILVTQEGTDEASQEAVRDALRAAGARVRAELSFGARMALTEDADADALAALVGSDPAGDPDTLLREAAERLADQVAFGTAGTDVLEALAEEGFLSVRRAESLLAGEPATGTDPVVVVVAGGEGEPALPPAAFLVPFVERLVEDGEAVAASESRGSEYPFVDLLRSNDVADRMVTADNVDEAPGEVALILALEDLLTLGIPGHYGVKDGATALLPAP